jgi:hypothetical protein
MEGFTDSIYLAKEYADTKSVAATIVELNALLLELAARHSGESLLSTINRKSTAPLGIPTPSIMDDPQDN